MKSIQIYIYGLFIVFCASAGVIHASTEKNERTE